jgi:mannose-6-phosphate isomerase-like protein (cupin superfamily)
MNAKELAQLNPDEREAFHRAAEAQIAVSTYTPPEPSSRPKDVLFLAKSDLLKVLIQVVREGGENNLHYHLNSNTNWMVLRGRARFYGVGDVLLAELGPEESILLPGGSRYRFEKTGEEDLEILQMVGVDLRGDGDSARINIEPHKEWMTDTFLQRYAETVTAE